ncbi:trypsin-1-like [Calliopsis andreniformis]|uniref:trypsin-1-like n=1 Tax=Calliopsis andreniformis TaxID=337506 RepID=UPI003FCD1771
MLRTVLLSVFVVGCLGSTLKSHAPIFPDSRIVGGSAVDIRDHPYQLSFQTTGHICGASVISSNWAITAAHCVGQAASRYSLRAGSTNKDQGVRYAIKRVIRHPNYDSYTIDYDVALLEIDGAIKLSGNVQPVKLAGSELPSGSQVNITGWGATKEGGMTSSNLMRVSVPLVDRKKCQSAYGSLNPITERMICAGYTEGGKDSCQGDSGGPLTANGVLYGIVSWGYGCARPKYPGVYTNVANLRSWIKQNSGV